MRIISRAVYIFACALPAVLFCTLCGRLMLPLAIAVAMHELSHIVMLRIFGGRTCGFRPAPFGLCIEYDKSSISLFGEAMVCGAGCMTNIALALLSYVAYSLFNVPVLDFFIVNLALCFINMFPAGQLDGGRILEIMLEMLLGVHIAYKICVIVTYTFGFIVFLFASYSLLTSQCGLYPLLFSVYLFVCNAKILKKAVFDENKSI